MLLGRKRELSVEGGISFEEVMYKREALFRGNGGGKFEKTHDNVRHWRAGLIVAS